MTGMEQGCLVLRSSSVTVLAAGPLFCGTLASAPTTDLPEAVMLSMAPSLIHGDLPFLEV